VNSLGWTIAFVFFAGQVLLTAAEPAAFTERPELRSAFNPPAEFQKDFGKFRSPLLFENNQPVGNADDWKKRRQEIISNWQEFLGKWPPLLEHPRTEIIEKTNRENFSQARLRLEIAPNQFEEAYLLIPQGKGPFPAVVVPYYEPKTSIGLGQPLRDFAYQLTKRGFVTLSIGSPGGSAREPDRKGAECQPLFYLAYVAANACNALANMKEVIPDKIGIVGHSYGGKWAMFASCFYEKFACAVWCDGGIVFDESRANVNYWEPWYLGYEQGKTRKPGVVTDSNPRTGAYRKLVEQGRDLHELHALMAPRPFLVSGGSEDPPERWKALNHAVTVNKLLGYTNRVAMTNRPDHAPTAESNEQIYAFFEAVLLPAAGKLPQGSR
jgi:dienelactone hydrolase